MAPENSSLFSMTDEQAMWRVQTQDDPEAFAQIVRRWEGPIQRLCVRMTGDFHRGQDLAQEAFARLFTRRKLWQPTAKLSTWLWRIAINLCHDQQRRQQRRPEGALAEGFDDEDAPLDNVATLTASPAESLEDQEQADIVRLALQKLPETHRVVVVLRHYEGLKFREVAEVLGIPEGTVKSRMTDALTQLARHLAPHMERAAQRRNFTTPTLSIAL